jgi:curli biogenesis system outer membrane secretion channel CsgG
MKKYKMLFAVVSVVFLVSCATVTKIDPTAFIVDTGEIEKIPTVCKKAYESSIPTIAVVNFTNNTTFEYAKMVQTNVQGSGQKTTVGGAAVGVGPGVAGIVWGEKEKTQFQADSQRIEREVNAKLSESVEDGVINELVNMGGAKIVTRTELQKVISEHKFQQSGLVDDKSLVMLGKLAGVKFIVTGSITNVNLSYKTFEEAKQGASKHLGLFGSLLSAGLETQEGWNIEIEISIRILDVETGEILFSKAVRGKEIIGKTPYPNYDALIGGMKKAAAKGLEDARSHLSKHFVVRGYILQTRTSPDGKEKSALINIGDKQGLKPGSKLIIYTFQEIKDPFTGNSTCDKVKLPVEAEVTNQIQEDKAWILITGDYNQVRRVRAGALVERAQLEGQNFFKKLGY